jgi:large subunit ribosomal protein L10
MENPRPEKVAVVEEVRGRLASANASVVTEYRGLTVTQLAELRKSLAAVGDYKIYKNTLVRLAVAGSEYEGLAELLTGPTAIAFVNGEVSAAAKALRDFARANPALIVKGGLSDGSTLTNQDLIRLADLPSRDVLLARFAGGLAAPLQQLAGLIQALPRNLAYGISALLEQRQAAEPAVVAPAESVTEAVTEDETTEESAETGEHAEPEGVAEAPAEAAEPGATVETAAAAEPEATAEAPAEAAEPEATAEDVPAADES